MTTILVFGNPHLKEDNFALKVAEELRKSEVKNLRIEHCVVFDDIFKYKNHERLYLMDVVEGVKRVTIFDNIDKIKSNRLFSLHDFDLGFYLKLMRTIGKLRRITVIGVPVKGDKKAMARKVRELLSVA